MGDILVEQLGKDNTCRAFSLEMRNLIAHPRGSHWDMNQIKFKGF
jgi:hypothetical protein